MEHKALTPIWENPPHWTSAFLDPLTQWEGMLHPFKLSLCYWLLLLLLLLLLLRFYGHYAGQRALAGTPS